MVVQRTNILDIWWKSTAPGFQKRMESYETLLPYPFLSGSLFSVDTLEICYRSTCIPNGAAVIDITAFYGDANIPQVIAEFSASVNTHVFERSFTTYNAQCSHNMILFALLVIFGKNELLWRFRRELILRISFSIGDKTFLSSILLLVLRYLQNFQNWKSVFQNRKSLWDLESKRVLKQSKINFFSRTSTDSKRHFCSSCYGHGTDIRVPWYSPKHGKHDNSLLFPWGSHFPKVFFWGLGAMSEIEKWIFNKAIQLISDIVPIRKFLPLWNRSVGKIDQSSFSDAVFKRVFQMMLQKNFLQNCKR